jgi:hypothetical protein
LEDARGVRCNAWPIAAESRTQFGILDEWGSKRRSASSVQE